MYIIHSWNRSEGGEYMAVWGIGAYYKNLSPKDRTDIFLKGNCAYVGWSENDAPAIHQMFNAIKIGDLIYIKSFVRRNKRLHIKAIGIVTSTEKKVDKAMGSGIGVRWVKDLTADYVAVDIGEIVRNNVFNNTLYEEYNPKVIDKLIGKLLD